jgi:hypothetical protein
MLLSSAIAQTQSVNNTNAKTEILRIFTKNFDGCHSDWLSNPYYSSHLIRIQQVDRDQEAQRRLRGINLRRG